MNIRQGKDETLQAYVDLFNDESLQVESRTDQVVISAFMNGLNPGKLYTKLAQSTPKSIEELLQRVEHFQKGEERDKSSERMLFRRREERVGLGTSKSDQSIAFTLF